MTEKTPKDSGPDKIRPATTLRAWQVQAFQAAFRQSYLERLRDLEAPLNEEDYNEALGEALFQAEQEGMFMTEMEVQVQISSEVTTAMMEQATDKGKALGHSLAWKSVARHFFEEGRAQVETYPKNPFEAYWKAAEDKRAEAGGEGGSPISTARVIRSWVIAGAAQGKRASVQASEPKPKLLWSWESFALGIGVGTLIAVWGSVGLMIEHYYGCLKDDVKVQGSTLDEPEVD